MNRKPGAAVAGLQDCADLAHQFLPAFVAVRFHQRLSLIHIFLISRGA